MGGHAPEDSYFSRSACDCGPPPELCVADDEVLTHHGKAADAFIDAPRINRGRNRGPERDVSLLRGKWTARDATIYRFSHPTPGQLARAVVRCTTAGKLRSAGFAVLHTPGALENGPHVSVVWPADNPMERQDIPWPKEVADRFTKCFDGDADS